MSEEIIIDGVNVAECEFLRHCVIPDNEGCKIDDSLCCDVGNCYYKQLQRAKAENEKLKKDFKEEHAELLMSRAENERLKATHLQLQSSELKQHLGKVNCERENYELHKENKELKKENKKIKKWLERYKNANERLYDMQVDDFNFTKTNYKQALEEIRDYIQSLNKDICNNCGWHNTDGCSPNGYLCHDLIEMQNKINEVLG